MIDFCYYILKDVVSSKKEGELVCGERIFAVPTSFPLFNFNEGEGPFFNLSYLIENSKIHQELKRVNPKRANKIIFDKYIVKIADLELNPEGTEFEWDYIDVIQHARLGTVNKGKLTGIHFYDEKNVKIIKKIDSNEKGVWSAIVEARDKNGNWVRKDSITTFFPNHWDKTTSSKEILYAVENKKQKKDSENIYISETFSGILVEIIIVNNKMKTIYPIL
jgi:hypothetical protein